MSWGAGVHRGVRDWFSLVLQELQQGFPTAQVSGKNGCMLAAKLSFISLCLEQHLEEDVDLVFLEYQPVGSWALKDEYYAGLERLMRKVRNLSFCCSVFWGVEYLDRLASLLPSLLT